MKRLILMILVLTLSASANSQTLRKEYSPKRVHAALSAGLGIPKIPFSNFRTPVSILGGASVNLRLMRRIAVQLKGNGLYTFSLGTGNGQDGEFRFNLLYGTLDLMYRVRGNIRQEFFVSAGLGQYSLDMQVNDNIADQTTSGFTIALTSWTFRKKLGTEFELRWHVLFEPGSDIQILTLMFGLIL